jgi:hypothetical protein
MLDRLIFAGLYRLAPKVLALQLPTGFEMRTLSGGLVGSAPE